LGQLPKGGRRPALVLDGDLATAVKRESAEAVMHFWGVKANTVWQWRKALGVPQYNEGTTDLKVEVMTPILDEAREKARPTWSSAERREKIAASKRRKPRPPHVVEAMRRGARAGRTPKRPGGRGVRRTVDGSAAEAQPGGSAPVAGAAWLPPVEFRAGVRFK
jgi:hypothetical protein